MLSTCIYQKVHDINLCMSDVACYQCVCSVRNEMLSTHVYTTWCIINSCYLVIYTRRGMISICTSQKQHVINVCIPYETYYQLTDAIMQMPST